MSALHQQARATTDYVIRGVTGSLARPVSLLLGRFDDHGVLRYPDQTHPINAGHRRELAWALRGLPFQRPVAPVSGSPGRPKILMPTT